MLIPLNIFFLAVTDTALVLALRASLAEKEKRASFLTASALTFNTALWASFMLLSPTPLMRAANSAAAGLVVASAILSMVKRRRGRGIRPVENKIEPFDERDHMFSRNALKFHPELAGRYYALHPERKEVDAAVHGKAEVGEPGQAFHDPIYSQAFQAAFDFLDRSRPMAAGAAASEKTVASPSEIQEAVRRLAFFYGAADVGFVKIRPHHLYSRRGRQAEEWGEIVDLKHAAAVVLITAMDLRMIRRAPSLPVILESSRQYVESAKTAFLLAGFLRRLGYQARAHTDANYLTVCVPAARASEKKPEPAFSGLAFRPIL